MSAIKYVKWPKKSQFDGTLTNDQWKSLDKKMREFIAEKIGH